MYATAQIASHHGDDLRTQLGQKGDGRGRIKLVIVALLLMVATAEAATGTETDIVRYAITQGGLLAVVIILLWSYRKDTVGALAIERDRVQALMDLVGETREAMVRTTEAIASQSKSIDDFVRTVENLERRQRR